MLPKFNDKDFQYYKERNYKIMVFADNVSDIKIEEKEKLLRNDFYYAQSGRSINNEGQLVRFIVFKKKGA